MPGKILIVDDDPEFRKEFKECFSGYDVVDAPDGDAALRMLKKPNEIDLVLLDIKMPGTSGTDVLCEIKTALPDLPVVILTGFSSESTAIEALKGHADDYIEKPFDPPAMREVIERFMEMRRRRAGVEVSESEDKMARVRNYLQRNCFRKVTLDDAAQAVGLSAKYLSRIFKEVTGKGFSAYRQSIQICKAREMILTGRYSVGDISEKLGYQNPESFIRTFKKLTGCTPTAYRKRQKTK